MRCKAGGWWWSLCLAAVLASPAFAGLPGGVDAEWSFGVRSMVPLAETPHTEGGMIGTEVRLKGTLLREGDWCSLYATPELRVNDAVSPSSSGGAIRYSDSGTTLRRNLTLSSRGAELSFRELYVEKSMWESRWRAGNQVFPWGTADFINPTSYFNPEDLRELFLTEEDALLQGVPALSMQRFVGSVSVEAVVMPVGIARLNAREGDYFYITPDNLALPMRFDGTEAPDVAFKNAGVGVRASRSAGGCDLSVSLYHGPDREPLITPDRVTTVPGEPVTLVARSFHGQVSSVGADLSADLGTCVAQVEGAWSFGKPAYETPETPDLATLVFPWPVSRSDFWSVSAGFNWFVPLVAWFPDHEGETVVTVEGHRAGYTKGGLGDAFYEQTLALRYQDTFLDGHVPVSLSWVMDGALAGQMTWAKVGYDFQNGVVVEGSVACFDGEAPARNEVGSPFWYLRDRDLLALSVTWVF